MNWVLIYISMIVIGIYAFYSIFIFLGFYITPTKKTKTSEQKFISIIVPFRNEEKNLPALLLSLKKIEYPKKLYEIIFINDHSTDNSITTIQPYLGENIILIHSTGEGKKQAISEGIKAANGNWILTTDADCEVSSLWLQEINSSSSNMVLGPVELKGIKKLLHYFQEFEWAALQSISAGSSFWKKPFMSNGANIAYEKKHFEEKGLKNETASGDDVFLLEDFKKKKLSVEFSWKMNSLVQTQPINSWKELISQKVRWASKSKYNRNKWNVVLGLLVMLVNIVVIISWINLVLWLPSSQFYCMVLMVKVMADITFMLPYLILVRRPQVVLLVPFFVFAYPMYFLWVLVLSLSGKYNWKGREYRA